MKPLRWSANLSLLWSQIPFLDRFCLARDMGFETVEFWWPRGTRLENLEAAVKAADVSVALLNMDAGDLEAGERGYLNRPELHDQVIAAACDAVALAAALDCHQMNVPVGKDSGADRDRQLDTVVDVLGEIAGIAGEAGILVTLEPLNPIDHPSYLMCSTASALDLANRAGAGVRLMYDAFHMGATGEDIVTAARTLQIAHVQVADYPGRHEPGTGRLPYLDFFNALEIADYPGYVGAEYAPLDPRSASLAWLTSYRRRGETVGGTLTREPGSA